MKDAKYFGVLLIASLLLLNGLLPPASWAQDNQRPPDKPTSGQEAAAGATNVLYVPGKAIGCVASAALWVVQMAVTLGGGYKDATNFVNGGCGGKWVVRGEDIAAQQYPE